MTVLSLNPLSSNPDSEPNPDPGTDLVPEPATMLLFGAGLAGLAGY